MWPELKKGDVILVRGVDEFNDIAVGDIVAFRHGDGITVHRLIEVSGDTLTTKGDANDAEDEPVQFDQVIGKLVSFRGSVVKLPQFGGLVSIFGPLVSRDAEPSPDALLQRDDAGSEETPPEALFPGTTELASITSDGRQFDGPSTEASLSADGQFVAFFNTSDGLVYVRSRTTNTTEAVSVNNSGVKANRPASQPSISGDGRYVVFAPPPAT
jgi:hypothetical protein